MSAPAGPCVVPPHVERRHNLGCHLAYSASYLTASSSLLALWRAGALYAVESRSYHTLGCRNSAFVMAVISLLCSQVELR